MMRLQIIANMRGWRQWSRAEALRRYAPPGWKVEICLVKDVLEYGSEPWLGFDVVLLLDYVCATVVDRALGYRASGHPSLIVCFDDDSRRRPDVWLELPSVCDWILCVSRDRWEKRGPVGKCTLVRDGFNGDVFRVRQPLDSRPEKVVWLALEGTMKQRGWPLLKELIPLAEEAGFACDFREAKFGHLPTEDELATWYNSAGYVVSVSMSEGSSVQLMEAAACGCVPVSTVVGGVQEWGGEEVVLCEPSVEAVLDGLLKARGRRATALAERVREWCWSEVAGDYYAAMQIQGFGNVTRGG